MFVQVGSEEVLYDDSTRLVERARQAGCSARLQIWPDMPHVHQIAFGLIPEGRAPCMISPVFWPNIANKQPLRLCFAASKLAEIRHIAAEMGRFPQMGQQC